METLTTSLLVAIPIALGLVLIYWGARTIKKNWTR
jgi:hypothetical protein